MGSTLKAGIVAGLLLGGLSIVSLSIGVADLASLDLLWASRLPRTLALVLTGMSLAVAGMIMQMIVQNRFVEPATTGTLECAALGMLGVLVWNPEASVFTRMTVATIAALAGTLLYLQLIRRIRWESTVIVPLVGMVYAGIAGAVAGFIAFQEDLLQTLYVWMQGDFSAILRGRYELLWMVLPVSILAYWSADRFTLIGLGRETSETLGIPYRWIVTWGLILISVISASTLVTAGLIPFVGLLVPNLVSLVMGDNLRRALPWVALSGALLLLLCDIVGRLITFPYEVPVGTVTGLVGSAGFLVLLAKRHARG